MPNTSRTPHRRLIRFGATGLLLALALTSCSARTATDTETAAAGDTAITVTDQRGKEITLDGPAEKVAFAVIPAPAMWAGIDGSYDRVAGINKSTLTANEAGIFGTMFPASLKTPVISASDFVVSVETLAEIDPDVVIQWGDSGNEIVDPIEAAGYPVVGLKYGTQEDLEIWIDLFSDLAGKSDRGDELIAHMHDRIAAITALADGVADESPRVLTLSQAGDGYKTANAADYANFWITLAGGTQVAADFDTSGGSVSAEQILKWNPEVIILGAFDEMTPADVLADPALASVDAVKNGRVYKNPLGGYRWEVPNLESPLMWQWTFDILHPDQGQSDLRTQIADTFDDLYGYAISDDEIDQVLRLDVNSDATDYTATFAGRD